MCGCRQTEDGLQPALQLRQQIETSEKVSFTCGITADYGENLYSFSAVCHFDRTEKMEFSVIKPDSIAGITGIIDQEEGNLTFDGQALAFPLLADDYISPISAPWVFMKALRSGYIASYRHTEDGLLITLDDSYGLSQLQVDVWTDENTIPIRSEMLWKGRRILSLEVEDFSCV